MLLQLLLQITPKIIHITKVIGIATVLKEVYTPEESCLTKRKPF